jgi:molecular chaperone DnaK
MTRELVERSIKRVAETLKEVKLTKNEIEEIVLVGGTTLIPAIRTAVKEFFGKEPNTSINPEEVVAMGASIQAEILKSKKEGRAPEGDIKSVLLLDVLPLSFGIETLGGISTPMIAKNTTIPTSKTQIFSTAADNQPSVEINVLQGERPMAQDNRSIGRFLLDGVMPAPRGLPQIEVAFDVDANGILTVTAKDKATNKTQSVKIEGTIGLSKEEIEKMKKEAEIHAQEDIKKKDLIEAKNIADNLIYTCEKTLKEAGDKVSADIKKDVDDKVAALKKTKEGDNIDDIKKQTEELSQSIQKVGAEMYKNKSQDKPEEGKSPETEEGKYKEK